MQTTYADIDTATEPLYELWDRFKALNATKNDYDAEVLIANALPKAPNNLNLLFLHCSALYETQRFDEAMALLDKILNFPMSTDDRLACLLLKANTLTMLMRLDEGISLYEDIMPLLPDPEIGRHNHAVALHYSGRPVEALNLLNEGSHTPDAANLFLRGMLYLGLGNLKDGWRLNRVRNCFPGMVVPSHLTRANTLADLKDKPVVVMCEGGLGDTIHFIRYVEMLKPHCKVVKLAVQTHLVRLCKTMDRSLEVIDLGNLGDQIDRFGMRALDHIFVLLMDLPELFETDLTSIPTNIPYFHVPYPVSSYSKPQIGVVWAGGTRSNNFEAHQMDRRRSIPKESFQPLFDLDQFDWVSLQQPHFVHPRNIQQPILAHHDMLDTAHVIQGLDLVITVDSSVAHLAGALGKKVWLLSRLDGCWRWFWVTEGTPFETRSPWYPSMRIFRQKTFLDWTHVIEDVRQALLNEYNP